MVWHGAEMLEILLLPLEPGGLLGSIACFAVAARPDDACDPVAEPGSDVRKPLLSALVLHGIVKQSRDGHVLFGALLLQDEPGHAHEMRDVGDPGLLSRLAAVDVHGIDHRCLEPRGKQAWDWE